MLVSDLAGRSNLVMKARELGFRLTNDMPELKPLRSSNNASTRATNMNRARVPGAAHRGALEHKRDLLFTVDMYHVSMRRDARDSICEATVKVRVGSTVHHTVAEGDGPVNALDGALRAALIRSVPQLSKVMLTDYKVRILNAGAGTAAKTRVLIESTDGRREWGTVGVSENIIEASLQALADSIEYALLRR